jgi:deoxyribodipyrimidine photo-lyase
MVPIVVFLFHRDLRIVDHRPLQAALDTAAAMNGIVLPLFIFEDEQVGSGAVRSERSISCLIQSLKELSAVLPGGLCIMYGAVEKCIKELAASGRLAAVFETCDYTPYAVLRQNRLSTACSTAGCLYTAIPDLYLHEPGSILNGTGRPYQKFTPFYEAALKKAVAPALGKVAGPFADKKIVKQLSQYTVEQAAGRLGVRQEAGKAGRKAGEQLLRQLPRQYIDIHDDLTKEQSGLSVHHHYGTVSIRESWWAAEKLIKKGATQLKGFQRQLLWRDFYAHLVAAWDILYAEKYGALHAWVVERPKLSAEKKKRFEAWCRGETGIPLVDAAMRQMNTTGFMHNRGRLVVASVLTRDWGIPWQWGAGYFAEKLADYDYVQNTMNWLHVAEHFPFSQAPFRRHDPFRTAEKLDPTGEYIKKWLV